MESGSLLDPNKRSFGKPRPSKRMSRKVIMKRNRLGSSDSEEVKSIVSKNNVARRQSQYVQLRSKKQFSSFEIALKNRGYMEKKNKVQNSNEQKYRFMDKMNKFYGDKTYDALKDHECTLVNYQERKNQNNWKRISNLILKDSENKLVKSARIIKLQENIRKTSQRKSFKKYEKFLKINIDPDKEPQVTKKDSLLSSFLRRPGMIFSPKNKKNHQKTKFKRTKEKSRILLEKMKIRYGSNYIKEEEYQPDYEHKVQIFKSYDNLQQYFNSPHQVYTKRDNTEAKRLSKGRNIAGSAECLIPKPMISKPSLSNIICKSERKIKEGYSSHNFSKGFFRMNLENQVKHFKNIVKKSLTAKSLRK
ncbi:unnamed protein product [Moneuplotes crassus]|uniref:Uncharacterized protein n=1 Tax=Euplotes crassus TaxID=5936 RepID=A0AAD1UG42_EUPCR|nr:unnamed protein product [Moneuplotes crassus]